MVGRLILAGVCAVMAAGTGPGPYVIVLGIAQDGGAPQAGCTKACCVERSDRQHVACLGIVDPASGERWLIDATPDLPAQIDMLDEPVLSGILLTHAHIGHYTGLMHLGHEVMGADRMPVYAMPRMIEFLSSNGPWDQLVKLGNIELRPLTADNPVALNDRITVTPFLVPHRDEYSEAVGFRVDGPERSVLYIPDIDKWQRWDRSIEDLVADVDVAFLDGTFYADGELPGRDMSGIAHPFIAQSIERFGDRSAADCDKIRFIHLNHTNPALRPDGETRKAIESAGFHVAREREQFGL